MKKLVYIACSYQNRTKYSSLINLLKNLFGKYKWKTSVPAFDLANIAPEKYQQIMNKSFTRLSQSSLLIAEASEKNIGIGIEVGYAKALHIPIIYLYQKNLPFSTTVAGTADYIINYSSPDDAIKKIETFLFNQSTLENY